MQVRLPTITLTEDDRRAIRFATNHKRTPATRDEARDFLQKILDDELAKLRYRWSGTGTSSQPTSE